MGVLSDSARKAYKVGARRAHVPEWFVPAAYAFGTVAVLVLAYGIVFNEPPERAIAPSDASTEVLVIDGDGQTSQIPATSGSNPATGTGTDTDAGTSGDTGSDVTASVTSVTLLDGGVAEVPAGANEAGQLVVFALLTGDFSDVTIYPGKAAPILLSTWDEPLILGLVSFESYADGSLRLVHRADPDATGPEPARDVPILLARDGDSWAYLPG
jgi:hypothetical protein